MSIVDYFKVKKNNGIVKKDPFAKFVDKDAVKGIKKLGKNLTAPKAKTEAQTYYTGYDVGLLGISKVENGVLVLQDKGLSVNNFYSVEVSSVDEFGRM